MATQRDYDVGAAALSALVKADILKDVADDVPPVFRGMIPADMADQIARQVGPAGARAVIDAVDADRAKRNQPPAGKPTST